MAFYKTCNLCGATLDPGENCDCEEQREREVKRMEGMFQTGKNGQMQLLFKQEVMIGEKAVV